MLVPGQVLSLERSEKHVWQKDFGRAQVPQYVASARLVVAPACLMVKKLHGTELVF